MYLFVAHICWLAQNLQGNVNDICVKVITMPEEIVFHRMEYNFPLSSFCVLNVCDCCSKQNNKIYGGGQGHFIADLIGAPVFSTYVAMWRWRQTSVIYSLFLNAEPWIHFSFGQSAWICALTKPAVILAEASYKYMLPLLFSLKFYWTHTKGLGVVIIADGGLQSVDLPQGLYIYVQINLWSV